MKSIAKTVPAQIIDPEFDTTSSDQSSVHKTIETPELLEHILSHLPSLDLCHARRVSQSFRNAIDRSPALQKNLFLVDRSSVLQKNCSLIPLAYSDLSTFGPDFANCLLIDQHDFEVAQTPELHPSFILVDEPETRPASHFHPILALDEVPRNLRSDFQTTLNILYLSTDHFDGSPAFTRAFCKLHKLTQTFDNVSGLPEDSPLHRMFITNPPIKKVEFTIRIPFWDAWQEWVDWESVTKGCDPVGIEGLHVLKSDTGITFGQLFEYTEEAVRGQQKRILPDPLPEMDYWRDPYP
jgi:hypothetical protein